MKEITVQTFNGEEKIEESKLVVENKETLIIQSPKGLTQQQVLYIHKAIVSALEGNDGGVVAIPSGVTFKTIAIK